MKYIDERIIFDFNDITSSNYNGVYRYDILLDNETIFVGNVFSDGNTPKIDITDVLRNFYDTNHNFTETPTKSNIIREVTVVLYNKDQTYEESMTDDVCFIYRQQNYNSLVTTPVLEDLDTQNIATMPMLQGWDYSMRQGEFLPTYPKVDSCNLTFDFVGCYQNMPMINDFSVNYNNGLVDNPHYVNISGNGVYQYSLPMCMLLRGATTEVSEYKDATVFFKRTSWSNAPEINSSTGVLRCRFYFSSDSVIDDVFGVRFENGDYLTSEKTIVNLGEYKRWSSEIEITKDNDPFRGNFQMTLEFKENSGISETNLIQISPVLHEQYLENGSYKIHFYAEIWDTKSFKNRYYYKVWLDLEVITDIIATVCDANSINITTFTPINSSQRYSYKIANLDGKSRYFLKWRDRYGMTQIQPFKGTHTYSENVEKSTITNYQNIKKITDVSVNGKWKLNTDWISERLYPFYESIFVSPWLQLYDAKEDKVYSVILTNTDYTEKTFKNQNRSLFNLQLEVELDSTQTIIY